MKNFIIILLILLSSEAYCQLLKGTILDKGTKKPIDFAVIYFAGTFVGTNTDKNGNFELDISKNISMTLTISALGYYSVNVADLSAGKPLMVYLAPKVFELNEVVIGAGNIKKDKREREKNLKLFRKRFLGETPNARLCKILNENDILFTNENDTLKAFSSKPILVDNNALGYRITFFLDKFEYDANELLTYFKGNILFSQDLALKDSQAEKFERKRRRAYSGSRMQFFRALWDNKLDTEGFTVTDSMKRILPGDKLMGQANGHLTGNNAKYFKLHGAVWVKYRSDGGESRLEILKDSVDFDRNGSTVEGIRWFGKIGNQRIGDTLPFEYYPDQSLAEEPDQLQNQLLHEDSMVTSGNQKLNNALPGEKVYLHLDRPNYMQGDTIWFKAYSWFGYDQLPDTVSNVLYVDLLNPKDSVELKRKLLIQNGASVGEFSLDKNIPPGRYTIRAYTRWMQNENTGEPFYQTVTINSTNQNFQVDCSPLIIKQADGDSLRVAFRFYEIDQAGDLKNDFTHKVNYTVNIGDRMLNKGESLAANTNEQVFKCRLPAIGEKDSVAVLRLSIKDERLTFEKQFRIPLKEELDLQFSPESGSLINDIESRVAFKAIGTDGRSREVKGVIKDEKGEMVTSFGSSHKGMGDFAFTPVKDKKYTAWLEYNHRLFNFPLPSATDEGFVMSVNYSDSGDTAYVRVKYSPSKKDEKMVIAGSAYGKIRFIANIKATSDSSMVTIPVELLPEGVSRITLFGSDFKPLNERLIFIDKGERFRIEVIADSTSYSLRSK